MPQTRWLRPPRRGRWVTDRGSGHRSGFPCSAPGRPVQDGPCADHTCSSPVRSGRVGTESGRALSKRLPSREDDGCECLGHCHPWAVGQRVCPDRRKYRDHSEGRRASRSGDKRGHRDARDAPQLGARHGSAQAVPPAAQAEPPHRTWASRAPTVWATPSRSVQARDPRPPAPGSAHTAPAGTAPQAPAQGPRRLLSAPGTRGSSEPPQRPSQHHLCVCSPPGRELSRAGPRLGGPPSEAHSLRNGGHMNGGCGTAGPAPRCAVRTSLADPSPGLVLETHLVVSQPRVKKAADNPEGSVYDRVILGA